MSQSSILGATALASAAWLSTGCEAAAQTCSPNTVTPTVTQNVTNYGTMCPATLPGTNTSGICLASIHAAVQAAVGYFTTSTGCNNYLLTIGNATASSPVMVDLTHDTSLAAVSNPAAWKPDREVITVYHKMSGIGPNGCMPANSLPQQDCLTIQGASGSTKYVSKAGANGTCQRL